MPPAKFVAPRAAATNAAAALDALHVKKPRKPRPPKQRPPGMTNKDWIDEQECRRAENL